MKLKDNIISIIDRILGIRACSSFPSIIWSSLIMNRNSAIFNGFECEHGFTHGKTFRTPSLRYGFMDYHVRKSETELKLYMRGYYRPNVDMALITNFIFYNKNSVIWL